MTTTFKFIRAIPAKETYEYVCLICSKIFQWNSTFIHPAFCPCCGTERQEAKFNRRYSSKGERG